MSVKESPLAKVKRLYGSKDKLVDSIVEVLSKSSDSESPEELKERLRTASNKKLLRLSESLRTLKEKHGGSKDTLVAAVSSAKGKAKDKDYVSKLQTLSIHRLLDMARSA